MSNGLRPNQRIKQMTSFNFARAYSNKSNATRAARAAKLAHFEVSQTSTGWMVVDTTPAAEPVRKRGGLKSKFSSIQKPCAVVREFVAQNRDMPRAEALAALVAMGVDRTTASIQFHKAHRAI